MEDQIMIQNERHIKSQEQKLDSYTGGINADLSGSLILRADKFLSISTAVYGTADSNGIMSEDQIIAWGKEEEAILRNNEWSQ